MIATPVFSGDCETSPVFSFSKALFLDQYTRASSLLPSIEHEHSPEMAQFLQQALFFKRGYQRDNPAQQRKALNKIDTLILAIADNMSEHWEVGDQIMLANIMLHAARLHLALNNVWRAVRLAQRGKYRLDEVLTREPNNVDALLTNGLYYYYSARKDDVLSGLLRWWPLVGDQVRGLGLMEQAVEQSTDFAFEAAHSLVFDVAWNRQDTCRYASLFFGLDTANASSLGAAKLIISLSLFCGLPEKALRDIISVEHSVESADTSFAQPDYRWFFEAKLYALSALGERKQLEKLLAEFDKNKNPWRYWLTVFSLAKAADVRGEHDRSAALFGKLLVSNVEPDYMALARIYLQRPYKAPRRFEQPSGPRLRFSCGS